MIRESAVSIDKETRSTENIRLGLDRYVACPEAELLTISFRFPEEGVVHWHRGWDLQQDPTPQMRQALERLHDYVAEGGLIRGWNVMFEWMFWNYVCVPKYGWPPLSIEQCRDTMAVAAAHNLPQSLDKCGEALSLPPEMAKSKRGHYLIQRLCQPHKPTKARPGHWVQDPGLFAELVDYCDQDVVAEEAIFRKLRPLTESQQAAWVLTQRINRRGVPVDLDETRNILAVVDKEKKLLNKELHQLTGGAVPAATMRDKLLGWCNGRVSEDAPIVLAEESDEEDLEPDMLAVAEGLENLRSKTVEDTLAREDLPSDVRRALEIRAAVAQTSTSKLAKMLKIEKDARLRNLFVWHGAGTGRWASRGGVNAQNFARPILDDLGIEVALAVLGRGDHHGARLLWGDRVMDAAVSCLRGVIKAPPGHEFMDADFSSVENRVAAFIAGQQDKLDLFRAGLDEYKTFASEWLYRVPYEAITKAQRQFTKPVILGGIFGLGARGLVLYAAQMGVIMTLEEAEVAIKALRKAYAEVRNCWYDCGDASIAAVRNPGQWFGAGEKLRLISHHNFLWMQLPSGRVISWSRPQVEFKEAPWMEKYLIGYTSDGDEMYEERPAMREVVTVVSVDTKTRQYKRHPLIGSSIFQSAVQGSATDVLLEGTGHTEAAGYATVLLAHDENLSLVEEGFGDPEEFGQLLCTPHEWREDLPLAYEAWRGLRFRK